MSLTPAEPTPRCPDCRRTDPVRRLTDPFASHTHRCGACRTAFDRQPTPEPEPRRDTFDREAPGQNRVVPYLREHGPTPLDDLPVTQVHHHNRERYGIRRVLLSNGAHGWGTAVYYLPEHEPAAVLDAYLDANPEVLDRDPRAVARDLKGHDDRLRAAWKARVNDAGGAWT